MLFVPKSASIMFGIGDEVTQRAVLDVQAAAVAEAVRYLERHACRTRAARTGYEIVPGDGYAAGCFAVADSVAIART